MRESEGAQMGALPPARAFVLRTAPKVAALRASIANALRAFRRFDLPYWLRSRFIPSCRYHVVKTGLPPGWHDVDERMLYACMALLTSYVEDEQGGADAFPGTATGRPEADGEALAIYRWWKVERHADMNREQAALMAWHGADERTDELFKSCTDLRDQNEARDQEMLHRLIDIRGSLWT